MGEVAINGSIVVTDACSNACSSGVGGDTITKSLGDPCGCSDHFQSVVSTGQALVIQTTGLPGAEFVDLDILSDLIRIEFLYLRSASELVIRIGAAPAIVLGVGGTFPTTFAGGETLLLNIDGTAFTVTFLAADQSAAQVAARINAEAALAGLATPRATVATSGQLQIDSVLTGAEGSVEVVGGTGAATLGFVVGTTLGSGSDLPLLGEALWDFPRNTNAPARIQVSGQSTLSVLAGGRTT
jgi:hypothetical protein